MPRYRVACGWLRDIASEPTPNDPWPCIRWDEALISDQKTFLRVMVECGVDHIVTWGHFISHSWPASLAGGGIPTDLAERGTLVQEYTSAARELGIKSMAGVGIYSWGFDQIIASYSDVSSGHPRAMCPYQAQSWDWQRRVLDFLMRPEWGFDGISMQSADQGRCDCSKCQARSAAAHHADILARSAEYVRAQCPDWIIGQAAWNMRIDLEDDLPYLRKASDSLDYIIEVQEISARTGRRAKIAADLSCALGSVGGVFVEPPQHWERSRWFVPCGLASAQSLLQLFEDGGRACEYFYRPFANPAEEVSWRTGALILSGKQTSPESALREAVSAVYGASGEASELLSEWYQRGEHAYFGRSNFILGDGPLSLEPLVWSDEIVTEPAPIYLRDRMSSQSQNDYASELKLLLDELQLMTIPNERAVSATINCIRGTLDDLKRIA
jgi:hypothetical protein